MSDLPNVIYLIDSPEEGKCWSDDPAPGPEHDPNDAVKYLKASEVLGDWISVKSDLPNDMQIVDVFCDNERYCNIEFSDGEFCMYLEEMGKAVDCDVISPTHWMPVPGGPNA